MEHSWSIRETNTHQDHVIAHVLGATVEAYFTANEVAYLLLDIGFVWIVYLDGEMGLVPQSTAIIEMEVDEETRTLLKADLLLLHDAAVDENALKRFSKAPGGCLIVEVEFQERFEDRRLVIACEEVSLSVETSLTNREFRINVI